MTRLPPFALLVVPITDTMLDAVRRGMLARGEEPDQHPADCECAACEVGRALDDDADMATSSDYWL